VGLFARLFLPHYCRSPESGFHREMYELLGGAVRGGEGQRIAVAAPRESAKSTLATLFLPLWCICYPETARRHFILIAGDTLAQAQQHIGDIKIELESNPRLAESFPGLRGPGPLWTRDEIVTRNGIKVTARGTGGYIRGLRNRQWRPDLLIGDDLENDVNSRTAEQRDKITEWFFKAFSKSASKEAVIVVIGTVLHTDSLLPRLLANPAFYGRKWQGVIAWSAETGLWEQWERLYTDLSQPPRQRRERADSFFAANRERMLDGTQVIWPAHRSYYDLMKLRVAEGPASFDSEIQNEPVNPRDCLFQSEWFRFFEESELDTADLTLVAAVDPSLGGAGRYNDPSAIICLGRDKLGAVYVLDAEIEKRSPDSIIEAVLELYSRRAPALIGVESVQFQEFFKDELRRRAKEAGIYPPVRGIKSTKDKLLRIQRLQPLVCNGTLRFQKRQHALLDQLRLFPKAEHDDGPDALEMALQMLEKVSKPEGFHFESPRTSTQQLRKVFG